MAAEESPGTKAWGSALVYVSKLQRRKMTLGRSNTTWEAMTKYVWAAVGQEHPLCSGLLAHLSVGEHTTINAALKDTVVAWMRTNSVPGVPDAAEAARGWINRMLEVLKELSDAEEDEVSERAKSEELQLLNEKQMKVARDIEDAREAREARAPLTTNSSAAPVQKQQQDALKHARIQKAKANCLKQGIQIYRWPSYFRLKDEGFHKIMSFAPDGMRDANTCSILLPSWDELVKIGKKPLSNRPPPLRCTSLELTCVVATQDTTRLSRRGSSRM